MVEPAGWTVARRGTRGRGRGCRGACTGVGMQGMIGFARQIPTGAEAALAESDGAAGRARAGLGRRVAGGGVGVGQCRCRGVLGRRREAGGMRVRVQAKSTGRAVGVGQALGTEVVVAGGPGRGRVAARRWLPPGARSAPVGRWTRPWGRGRRTGRSRTTTE